MKKILYPLLIIALFANIALAADISSWKGSYATGENVWIQLKDKPGNAEDWVGIYPADKNNDWNNVIAWKWANATSPAKDPGDWYKFNLNNGEYEARFFLNNSLTVEDKVAFNVSERNVRITSWKNVYTTGDSVWLELVNKPGNEQDWIGIYPKGTNNDWDNVISWIWAADTTDTDVDQGDWYKFEDPESDYYNGEGGYENYTVKLKPGNYEARFFLNNSYAVAATVNFTVKDNGEKEKKLLFARGVGDRPVYAESILENYERIEEDFPFDGFVMKGREGTFQSPMKPGEKILFFDLKENQYLERIKDTDFKKLKNNFLHVAIDYPGNFFDTEIWTSVSNNFKEVAKLAAWLGFKGIAFDDEPYGDRAHKMINYCSDRDVLNKCYSNNKTLKVVTDKLRDNFVQIMDAMEEGYGEGIEILVYHGPSNSHKDSNKKIPYSIYGGIVSETEMAAAIFEGLVQGKNDKSSIHDMGENYNLHDAADFSKSYQWRDTIAGVANNGYYAWNITPDDWQKKVNIGFMSSNFNMMKLEYMGASYKFKWVAEDIRRLVDFNYKEDRKFKIDQLQKSLKHSDKYAIFYVEHQNWFELDFHPGEENVNEEWKKAINDIVK